MDGGLLISLGVIVAFLGMLWVLADLDLYRERILRLARALHLAPPAAPHPSGAPIERIAADARRIRAEIRHAPPGLPVARMRGWLEAYDDVLVAACHALDLDQRLDVLPPGAEHELERERVERMLESYGLLLRSSA